MRIDGKLDQYVTVDAFGHTFRDLPVEQAHELLTLEREQAVYSKFWDDQAARFKSYRIPLTAAETFTYVEAELAQQEFRDAVATSPGVTLHEALSRLTNQRVARRVIDYGVSTMEDGTRLDIRGCPASFWPRELEELLCGQMPERYEPLLRLGDERDRIGLIEEMLASTGVVMSILRNRRHGKVPFAVVDEYDVQDIVRSVMRAVFASTRAEEWAPSVGGSSKRIDIVVPEAKTVIEVKYVRDARHARMVADELKIDFESYHGHPSCSHLFALVYDPNRLITDPRALAEDLSGTRAKGAHFFTVHVVIV